MCASALSSVVVYVHIKCGIPDVYQPRSSLVNEKLAQLAHRVRWVRDCVPDCEWIREDLMVVPAL